jgi:hypothetical protein
LLPTSGLDLSVKTIKSGLGPLTRSQLRARKRKTSDRPKRESEAIDAWTRSPEHRTKKRKKQESGSPTTFNASHGLPQIASTDHENKPYSKVAAMVASVATDYENASICATIAAIAATFEVGSFS